MSDSVWAGVRSLSSLEGFEKLPGDIEENPARFLEWMQHFTPELEKLPGDWRELDKRPFEKLMVVRIMRPDRLTAALTNFIRDTLPSGKDYVECDSEFSSYQVLESSFEDSAPQIPLYFILSPGANVVANVDKLAYKVGKTKGLDYHNISLGQGQDVVAAEKLDMGHRQGHWVFLNNVHLMPRWLTFLEKKLDEYALSGTHENFRVMLSSDPSTSIPVSILDRSIKITSDPPSGLKANLKQAFASFSKEMYEDLEPRTKGILFGLCQFHAVMVERKKFGSKGYNMMYPFSVGDLVCSAAVLRNYMESAPARVPWADLRYLFGEIMYGGHIVNDFDRLLANTYLDFFMREELLDEMILYPYLETSKEDAFRAPGTNNGYESVVSHIDDSLKGESPLAFGLHPNAEIGFRTNTSETLLRIILELSASAAGGGGGDGEGASSPQQVAEAAIQDILDTLRDVKFELEAVTNAVEEVGPFQNIVLQEAERMNSLIAEIVRSLLELDSGFKGDLTISDTMEDLANSLFLDRVPKKWEALAYPSLRGLAAWMSDLQLRIAQLNDWVAAPQETPICTWISGLFNPQSFLTAVMQTTAQKENLELDKLTLLTEVTKKMLAEEMSAPAKEGTYVIGLSLEGGSWSLQNALLEPSKPREMFSPLPVINVRPAVLDKQDPSLFQCPVYKTQSRGPT
jgi:dynein heavy chain